MRWQGRRGSSNIEDRRTQKVSARQTTSRGSRRASPINFSKMSPKTMIAVVGVLIVAHFMGFDVASLLTGGGGSSTQTRATSAPLTEADKRAGQFVSVTLADTEEIWSDIFRTQLGRQYQQPTLVLFKGVTSSPCGNASGATGPFYCPADKKAYLDTSFFVTMSDKLGASGDFAQAYVIAHEVAHHVQNELGILGKANQAKRGSSKTEANAITVRIELQADCLSGLWAREAERRFDSLEKGDLKEALNAARAIGDDTLQRNAGRTPMPHTYTHGTSAQRQNWFDRGYQTADIQSCDTFNTNDL